MQGFSHRYRVIRFHCVAHEHGLSDKKTRMGSRLGVYYAEDLELKLQSIDRTDIKIVNTIESARQNVFTRELVKGISANLDAAMMTPSGVLKPNLKAEMRQRISSQAISIDRLHNTISESNFSELKFNYKFEFKHDKKLIAASMFEPRAVDIYAVWMDWLDIDYSKSRFPIVKQRLKFPPLIESHSSRDNEIELNIPLGSFQYWHLLPNSCVVLREENYRMQITDNLMVRRRDIEKPEKFEHKYFDRVPSLYSLSNKAFKLKLWNRLSGVSRDERRKEKYFDDQAIAWDQQDMWPS